MVGEKSLPQLKKELDVVFSRFIRLRDSRPDDFGYCYTCGKRIHYKEGHCGHFVPRNILTTRWLESNCKLQCVGCNLYGNGKILDFEENLVKELGQEEVDILKARRHQVMKVNRAWYEEMIELYKNKAKEINDQLG